MDDAVEAEAEPTKAFTVPKTTFEAIRFALSLLSPGDRKKYYLVAGAQVLTSFLDMFGVLLIGLVGVLAAAGLQGTALPSGVQSIIDFLGLGDKTAEQLAVMAAVAAACLLLGKSLISAYLMRRVFRFLGTRQALISRGLTQQVLHLPLIELEKRSSQETAYAITTGVATAVMAVLGSASILLSEVALLVVLGVTLLVVNPVVTIVAFVFFALVGFGLQRSLSRRASSLGAVIGSSAIRGQQSLQEALAAYREIQVLGRRDLFVDSISGQWTRSGSALADNQFMQQIPKIAYEAALVFGAVALAAWQFATTSAIEALATLALFVAAGSRVLPSMLRLNGLSLTIRYGMSTASSLYSLVDELRSRGDADGEYGQVSTSGSFERPVGQIEVSNVSVAYPGADSPALQNVTLTIPPGTRLAVVGTTGAGKSTLADVILGVLTPQEGSVTIDNLPVDEVIRRSPGSLAYVPQNVTMFNGTVRDNVAIGLPRESVSDADIWRSLERARLDIVLRESREGLDTLIGERGVRLSGGQRQRLGLARALYVEPQILVLDEATSALDAETEQLISDALKSLSESVTVITIAHRLATVRDAHVVVYLDEGRVAAQGTFDEVRGQNAQFDHQAALLGIV